MKQCVKCKSELTRYKTYWKCKPCQKRIADKYKETPKGKALQLWYGLRSRAENPKLPTYRNVKVKISKQDFLEWALKELDKWVKDGYTVKVATLDRINSDGHYEKGNLQLLTKEENSKKKDCNKNLNAPEGFAWCGKCKAYFPKESFTKDKRNWHGLRTVCKQCTQNYDKQRYLNKTYSTL